VSEEATKGFTEAIVALCFGETIGETMFLEQLMWARRLDLSTSEGQEFLERFVVGQLKANRRMAREIDTLKDELQQLRLALIQHGVKLT
jgi:hypothetical protein